MFYNNLVDFVKGSLVDIVTGSLVDIVTVSLVDIVTGSLVDIVTGSHHVYCIEEATRQKKEALESEEEASGEENTRLKHKYRGQLNAAKRLLENRGARWRCGQNIGLSIERSRFESSCCRFETRAISFTPHCFSQLYTRITGYPQRWVSERIVFAQKIASRLNASQRSRVGDGMNRSARR